MEILADPGHWDGSRRDEANHSCHDAMQGPAARLHPRIEPAPHETRLEQEKTKTSCSTAAPQHHDSRGAV